ncbi:MAG: hypothetical protein R3F05_15750 [Planctomycetota bacterium]
MPSKTVLVRLGDARADPIELLLGGEAAEARVRVVDDAGAPLPEGSQVLLGLEGSLLTPYRTQADGFVVASDVDPIQPLRVSVPQQRLGSTGTWLLGAYGDVAPGDLQRSPPWELAVPRGVDFSATLRDVRGQPVPGVRLLMRRGDDAPPVATPVETDAGGRAALADLFARAPGDYAVELESVSARPTLWSGHVGVEPLHVDLRLPDSHDVLALVLVDAEGQAVLQSGLHVTAYGLASPLPRERASPRPQVGSARFDAMGRAHLVVQLDEPADAHELRLELRSGSVRMDPSGYRVEVQPPGRESRITLLPRFLGQVVATVERGALPGQGASVRLVRSDRAGDVMQGRTDQHGVASWPVVPAGTWRLEARTSRSWTQGPTFEVRPDERTDARMDLGVDR